jgi:hypothetical protein
MAVAFADVRAAAAHAALGLIAPGCARGYTLPMPGILRSAAFVLSWCAGATAIGQSLIQNENLLFSPPKDFKVGYQASHGNSSITEWIPAGETVQDWTQMLTVQIFHGASVDAATFLQGVGKRYMDACPGTTAKGIYTGQVNGYVVSMLLLKCPMNPATSKPETTAFRLIKGQDALYSVQRAWRAMPSDQDLDGVMRTLGKVTVCDTRTPQHPCPSFDSLVPDR